MLSKSLTAALFFSLTIPATAQESAHEGWHADYDTAVAAAKESGKDLLVDFTGSDWCGWCIRLKDEVFDTEAFMAEAPKHFELVALDFPNSDEVKAKVPNPERNQELNELHGISGYPTILLMTSDGLVYGRTGYKAGGPTPYLEMLETMRTEGKARLMAAKELSTQFEKATGEERMKLLGKMMATLEGAEDGDPAVALLGPACESCLSDEGMDQAMAVKVVKTLLGAGYTSDMLLEKAEELDPQNENGLLEITLQAQFQAVRDDNTARAALNALSDMLELGFHDAEMKKTLLTRSVVWANGPLDDAEMAKKFAKVLQPLLTEDDAELKQLVDEVLNG